MDNHESVPAHDQAESSADADATDYGKTDGVTQQSPEGSERMANDAKEAGQQHTSAAPVQRGGEQLNGIKERTEDIQEDLEVFEENISKLECCTCGLFRRRRRDRNRKNTEPRLEFNEQPSASSQASSRQPTPLPASGTAAKKTERESERTSEREDKMETNLRSADTGIRLAGGAYENSEQGVIAACYALQQWVSSKAESVCIFVWPHNCIGIDKTMLCVILYMCAGTHQDRCRCRARWLNSKVRG